MTHLPLTLGEYTTPPIEADLARVTAERDEAVALLRRWVEWHDAEPNSGMPKNGTRAFLAKIGGTP